MGEEAYEIDSHGPNYEISEVEADRLTSELINERVGDLVAGKRYVGIEINGNSRYANLGRQIERKVFEQAFEGNDAEMMKNEYGPYEDSSRFFVSVDTEKRSVTGVLRVIKNSKNGFMTLNDVQAEPFGVSLEKVIDTYSIEDLDGVWDVGTVAVLPEYRSGAGAVSVQLYRAMYLSALSHNIDHLVSIVDVGPLQKLTKYLGIPFVPLAGLKSAKYLGSGESQPVYGYVPEFYKKMNRNRKTIQGFLARKALSRLVKGSDDDSLVLLND